MSANSDVHLLIQRAAAGDSAAWGAMLAEHAERLERMVTFRLNSRLRGRVDPAEVVQDAFVEASAHRRGYFQQSPVPAPLFLWLRGIVLNTLLELHRHHLDTRMRSAARELRSGRTTPHVHRDGRRFGDRCSTTHRCVKDRNLLIHADRHLGASGRSVVAAQAWREVKYDFEAKS